MISICFITVQFIFVFSFHTSLTFQSNGLDERYNQTLQQMLAKFIHERKNKWDEFLDTCVYAYNTSVHESTHFTPFEVMFGRKAVLPVDIDMSGKDPKEKVKFCSEELSTAAVMALADHQRKLLEQAKGNIIRAQEKQKQQVHGIAVIVARTRTNNFKC